MTTGRKLFGTDGVRGEAGSVPHGGAGDLARPGGHRIAGGASDRRC